MFSAVGSNAANVSSVPSVDAPSTTTTSQLLNSCERMLSRQAWIVLAAFRHGTMIENRGVAMGHDVKISFFKTPQSASLFE
jgi:hypothetical protein